jgi:hypothetical protein
MDFKEIGWDGAHWIYVPQNKVKLWMSYCKSSMQYKYQFKYKYTHTHTHTHTHTYIYI